MSIKKLLPWNRLTKHLCVLFIVAVVTSAYFWKREMLGVLMIIMIVLVHRIEKDYRSRQRQCPQCRRWKCDHEFSRTICLRCLESEAEAKSRRDILTARPREGLPNSFPGIGKMPERPQVVVKH